MTIKKRKSRTNSNNAHATNTATTTAAADGAEDSLSPTASTHDLPAEPDSSTDTSSTLPLPTPTIPKQEEVEEVAVEEATDEAAEEESDSWPTELKTRPRSRSTKGQANKPVSSGSTTTNASSKLVSEKRNAATAGAKKAKTEEVDDETPPTSKRGGGAGKGRAGASAAATKGKKGKEKQLEEERLAAEAQEEDDEEEYDENGDSSEGVTRCVCDKDTEELSATLMIQCDTCKCWQHGSCVGLWKESDCPDRYFCEHCRPSWHGPGGLLRKVHRSKPISSSAPPPKSPQIPHHSTTTTTTGRNKPRESADAALVSAFLAGEQVLSSAPGSGTSSTEEVIVPTASGSGGGKKGSAQAAEMKAPKKRSTMNSRDAAYDDAIAMSILGPGSAAMRARLEKARSVSGGLGDGEDKDDHSSSRTADQSRRSQSKDSSGTRSAGRGTPEVPTSESHASKKRRTSVDGSAIITASDGVVKEEAGTEDVASIAEVVTIGEVVAAMDVEKDIEKEAEKLDDEAMAVEDEEVGGMLLSEKKEIVEGNEDAMEDVAEERQVVEELLLPPLPPLPAGVEAAFGVASTSTGVGIVVGTTNQEVGAGEEEDDEFAQNDDSSLLPPPPPRAKHPNQYTYRPKNGGNSQPSRSRASPVKRPNGSGLAGEKDSHRAGQRTARDWTPMEPMGWGLPDHLKHLSHLLPSALPVPLNVPTYTSTGPYATPNSHGANGGGGQLSDSSSSASGSGSIAGVEVHLEAPTKVKFPSKRMTMPEMKKRVRNVLDYLTRIQIDMSDRERRAEALERAVVGLGKRGKLGANGGSGNASGGSSDGGSGNVTPDGAGVATTEGKAAVSNETVRNSFPSSLGLDRLVLRILDVIDPIYCSIGYFERDKEIRRTSATGQQARDNSAYTQPREGGHDDVCYILSSYSSFSFSLSLFYLHFITFNPLNNTFIKTQTNMSRVGDNFSGATFNSANDDTPRDVAGRDYTTGSGQSNTYTGDVDQGPGNDSQYSSGGTNSSSYGGNAGDSSYGGGNTGSDFNSGSQFAQDGRSEGRRGGDYDSTNTGSTGFGSSNTGSTGYDNTSSNQSYNDNSQSGQGDPYAKNSSSGNYSSSAANTSNDYNNPSVKEFNNNSTLTQTSRGDPFGKTSSSDNYDSSNQQSSGAYGDDQQQSGAGDVGPDGYPEQRHAGKVGLGPHYQEGTGFGEKIEGVKEIIKGKVTKNPELVEKGQLRKSGDLKAREEQEEDAKDPFATAQD